MISIILPVFNEGKNIKKQVEIIQQKVLSSHEILVVYDFDNDNSIPVVKSLQKRYTKLKLVKNIFGSGLINAIKTGVRYTTGELVVIMPADLADNPLTINKMKDKILLGYDIVGATRYAKGGRKIGGSYLKSALSKMAGAMTPVALGIPITDISNGFKMYRKIVLKKIEIRSDGGWEFTLELVIKAHLAGYRLGEVPSVWRDRTSGSSKFKLLKWLPKYMKWYVWGISKRLTK